MYTIQGGGSFTRQNIDQINSNFNQLQALQAGAITTLYVNQNALGDRDGSSMANGFTTLQAALNAVKSGVPSLVVIAPGDYSETVTLSKPRVALWGGGGDGAVAIATPTTNASGITVTGNDCALYNVGGAGDGTGNGLLIQAERFRAYGGKYESGDTGTGIKLAATATIDVADTRLIGCELAWNVTGIDIDTTGGGNAVTETLIRDCYFHDCATDGIINATVATLNLWIQRCSFWGLQDGSEATQYLDLDTVGTAGVVEDCRFFTTVQAASKIAIAATILYIGDNRTQAEQPGTNAFATSGRPD